MASTLIIFLILLGILISISYLTFHLVSKELKRRRIAVENRLNNPLERENALKEINDGIAETNIKIRKLAPINIALAILLILLGFYGIGNFLHSYFIESSKRASEISIARNLIICPLIIFYGISIFIKNIKALQNK